MGPPKGGGPEGGGPNPEKVGPEGGGPEGWRPQRVEAQTQKKWGPEGGAPKGGAPKGGGPKISRFFFFPPATTFFLLSLSWGPCVEFWWCLKRRGPEMCTFGVLGLSCETPAAPPDRAAGARTRQPENSKRAHFRVPAFKNTNKIPRKDPKREKEERKLWREEKKREILGGPAEGCPAEGCPAEGCPSEGGSPEGGSSGRVHRQWGAGCRVRGWG